MNKINSIIENFKQSVSFLVVGKTKETTDGFEIKRYVGFGQVSVLAVNPTAAEIEKYMGYTPKDEPVYVGTTEVDGKTIQTARISFIVKTNPERCNGIDTTTMMTINLRNQFIKGSNSGKYQVMDAYGRDAWATKEDIEGKKKIMYKEGTYAANISAEYHPIYSGEKELISFLRTFLGVAMPANYVNGSWIDKTGAELEEAKLQLDNLANIFKGDFSEIKDAVALQPTNRIKVLFGIRTNDEGKQYQDIYTGDFLSANAKEKSYARIQKDIEEAMANGRYANRIYEYTDIHEYNPEATDFSTPTTEGDPFADAAPTSTPW